MAQFKGRVVEVKGKRITIDTSNETRISKDDSKPLRSAFPKPDIPKLGAVVRCNFRYKDIV